MKFSSSIINKLLDTDTTSNITTASTFGDGTMVDSSTFTGSYTGSETSGTFTSGVFAGSYITPSYSHSCYSYYHWYPSYWSCHHDDTMQKAFKIVKHLMDKKYIKVKEVKDFIKIVDEINKIL